ncbi:MAG: DUF3842 family protein [Clostridiales bacterium]|nr:DUF3842 family protein [Clostridiales bacterium]
MRNILVIDGQGGKLGRLLVESLRQSGTYHITAVGTNAIATSNMLRAEPDEAATGENAVRVCSRGADVICGPIGIVIADAMNGEVTPAIALAVGRADAVRVLIPMNRLTSHRQCANWVAGIRDIPMAELVRDAVRQIAALCAPETAAEPELAAESAAEPASAEKPEE